MTVDVVSTIVRPPVRPLPEPPAHLREPLVAGTGWPAQEPTDEPPDEPPAVVRAELLWRLAVRLHREHEVRSAPDVPPEGSADRPRRCRRCRQEWPCSGRRLAELGLTAASTRAGPG